MSEQNYSMNKQDIIDFCLDQNILISPELADTLQDIDIPSATAFVVLNERILELERNNISINATEFEKAIVLREKHHNSKLYTHFIEYITHRLAEQHPQSSALHAALRAQTGAQTPASETSTEISGTSSTSNHPSMEAFKSSPTSSIPLTDKSLSQSSSHPSSHSSSSSTVSTPEAIYDPLAEAAARRDAFMKQHRIRIHSNYAEKSKKRVVQDFVNSYLSRYKEIERILRSRSELNGVTSISRITAKKEKDTVALIGCVYEKSLTKNKSIMLTVEDPTGAVKVVISQSKEELYHFAEEIQLDEIIGITGTFDGIVFANNIFIPDIPLTKELKKSPEEGYFVLFSDTQFGNKLFLEKEFTKFLLWLNGKVGNERQREIASQVKYIFFAGDLVDGVGVYPDQEFDLSVIDIRDQYHLLAEYLRQIPSHIPIIFCPGNHDVGRIAEPQPALSRKYTSDLLDIPNIIAVSNPSMINIFAHPEMNFDGFDILFYHGYSFIYYAEHIPSIRQKGGQRRPDLIMKYLLQRRHLAPSFSSNLFVPEPKKDYLVIDKVPDFLFSGHIHRTSVSNYRNVTCINASAWVAKSDEQERRGLQPQPARAFVIDMQTREVKIMNFLSKEDQEKEAKESGELIEPVVVQEAE